MKEYLKAQNKTNDAVISNQFNQDELDRFSKSDYRWVDNRSKQFRHKPVKKGEIYQFEFGKNFLPEMSYEHRGLVIGVRQKLLYVLPIFSYNPARHTDVYHPIDFPNSTSDIFLLKNSDFSFIKHDSVLKLNDIRTVSVNRILYKHSGTISITDSIYKKIEELVLLKYFPSFVYEYKKMEQALSDAENSLDEKENEVATLTSEKAELKSQIDELNKKISNSEDN